VTFKKAFLKKSMKIQYSNDENDNKITSLEVNNCPSAGHEGKGLLEV
jgi:hypothetical protein